jgi:hypothetical protein
MSSRVSDSRSGPGTVLFAEVLASTLCAAAAVGVGVYANVAHGKWHLLLAGVIWLALSVAFGIAVSVFWNQLPPYLRLALRGLGDLIGVAAVLAVFLLSLVASLENEVPPPFPNGGGSPVVWLQLRRREHLAVFWLVAPAIVGALLAAVAVGAIASLQLADGITDVVGVGLLIFGVGLGLAIGYHIGSRRLLPIDRGPVTGHR